MKVFVNVTLRWLGGAGNGRPSGNSLLWNMVIYIYIYIYCRASHTGDAGRGRGRERERGMSSELANMTC